MQIIKLAENNFDETINHTADVLRQGGVLVCPTDTVYGLICDATNARAVKKIFEIKRRPKEKTLPIFIDSIKMAEKIAVFDVKQKEFLEQSWPGAKTIVLKAKPGIKISKLLIKDNTVALRIPDYRLILNLILELEKPLAQTSANISGKKTFSGVKEILDQLQASQTKPGLVIDGGDLPGRESSKIVDLTEDNIKILRK